MKWKILSFFLMIAICCVLSSQAMAWSIATHRLLSQKAAEQSLINITDYLKRIGLEGFNHSFRLDGKVQEISDWIQEGAALEDAGSDWEYITNAGRANNHFHNPLKPWAAAGLDDTIVRRFTGESSLLWAQDPHGQAADQAGDWSWQTLREHYYKALTAATESHRQAYFARTFRGLGHQIHLLQDAAQPDHARNDGHPENSFGRGIEAWAERQNAFVTALASSPRFPQVALDTAPSGLVPITQFIDTDQYHGTNPQAGLAIGLTEYANANFYSDGTIFSAEKDKLNPARYFPYPKKTSTDLSSYLNGAKRPELVTAADGEIDTGYWISKIGDGETITHFLKPSFFSYVIYQLYGDENDLFYRSFYRDERSYEAYAQKLIPRAVGYSAALINYFFRGYITLQSGDTEQHYVIVNHTNEAMEGIFALYYDTVTGQRALLWHDVLTLGARSAGNHQSQPIKVVPPAEARYMGEYVLVFRGRMGAERDAVVGIMVQDPPYVLKITMQQDGEVYYGFWDLLNNAEFVIRTSATGAIVPQPIAASDIPLTTAHRLRWTEEFGGSVHNEILTGSLLSYQHAWGPDSFEATQSAAADHVVRKLLWREFQPGCGRPYDVIVENWLGLDYWGIEELLVHPIAGQEDLDKLYGQSGGTGSLHFTNGPHFGTYQRAARYEEYLPLDFWCSKYLSIVHVSFEGDFEVLGVRFYNSLQNIRYFSRYFSYPMMSKVDYLGAYNMSMGRHGYIADDHMVVDILLVPQFENHEVGPDIQEQMLTLPWQPRFYAKEHLWGHVDPTNPVHRRIQESPEIFTGFKVASGFSVKRRVLKRPGAHQENWTDFNYATLSSALNHRLEQWIKASFFVHTYRDLPMIRCAAPVRQ